MRTTNEAIDIILGLPGMRELAVLLEGFVAGGAIVDTLREEEIRDIDVYTTNPDQALKLLTEGDVPGFLATHNKVWGRYAIYKVEIHGSPYCIDIMEIESGMMYEHIKQFDYRCNAIALELGGAFLMHLPGTKEDIKEGRLVPLRDPVPEYRTERMKAKGFSL